MRGPKQNGFERTLTFVSLVMVVVAFVWLMIDRRAFWMMMVTSFALAPNPLAQLHQERRFGRPGRSSYFVFVGLVTVGSVQTLILSSDGFPTWFSVAVAAFTEIATAATVILRKSSLRDRQPGRRFSPHHTTSHPT